MPFDPAAHTKAKKPSPKTLAKEFVSRCTEYGFEFSVTDRIVKVWTTIPVGNKEAFSNAETEASILFDFVPLRGGSVWGSDGGSMGGAIALQNGHFRMNKSGSGGKAFANAVRKLSEKR